MLQPPFRRGIWKAGSFVFFQGHTLDLHKGRNSIFLKGQIETGIAKADFPLRGDSPAAQPFVRSLIGAWESILIRMEP